MVTCATSRTRSPHVDLQRKLADHSLLLLSCVLDLRIIMMMMIIIIIILLLIIIIIIIIIIIKIKIK